MPAYEYKSITREHEPGKPYRDIGETLNKEGAEGWQLVSVEVIPAALVSIFYLMRQKTGPTV